MTGKQHFTLGTAAGVCIAAAAESEGIIIPAAALAGAIFGELYPDIDIETSIIGKLTGPVSRLINRLFGHRGFIHTPVNALLCTILLYLLLAALKCPGSGIISSAFLVGFLLHLLQDTLTKGGVMLFWPFLKTKVHLTNILTASNLCWVMTAALCALFVFLSMLHVEELYGFLLSFSGWLDTAFGELFVSA